MTRSAPNRESPSRVEIAIGRATAKHMSNAKWRSLFALLEASGVERLRWKLLLVPEPLLAHVPPASDLLPERFGDTLPAPYSQYRDLEWVEVPNEYASLFPGLLVSTEKFPWQPVAGGLRLAAYTW
jgi:hypothetical protein